MIFDLTHIQIHQEFPKSEGAPAPQAHPPFPPPLDTPLTLIHCWLVPSRRRYFIYRSCKWKAEYKLWRKRKTHRCSNLGKAWDRTQSLRQKGRDLTSCASRHAAFYNNSVSQPRVEAFRICLDWMNINVYQKWNRMHFWKRREHFINQVTKNMLLAIAPRHWRQGGSFYIRTYS